MGNYTMSPKNPLSKYYYPDHDTFNNYQQEQSNSTKKDTFTSSRVLKSNAMTCCIVCLADGGKSAVLAADNMKCWTVAPNAHYLTYSETVKKIKRLVNGSYVLMCGDECTDDTIVKLAKIEESDTADGASAKINDGFFHHLRNYQETTVLKHNGLTWDTINSQVINVFYNDIRQRLDNVVIDCGFIIVGKNEVDSNYYLCQIDNKGVKIENTDGVSVIGIGTTLATLSIVKSGYNKDMELSKVKAIVEAAMEEASHSPYVGKLGQLITLPS